MMNATDSVAEFCRSHQQFTEASTYLSGLLQQDGDIPVDALMCVTKSDLLSLAAWWAQRETMAAADLLQAVSPEEAHKTLIATIVAESTTRRVTDEEIEQRIVVAKELFRRVVKPVSFLDIPSMFPQIRDAYAILFKGDVTPTDIARMLGPSQRDYNIVGPILLDDYRYVGKN